MEELFGHISGSIFLVFITIWYGSMFLISKISGWSSLAKKYSNHSSDFVEFNNFQSIKLGWGNYSGCVSLAVTDSGLYMKLFFLFKPGHPDLLIPWSAFGGYEKYNAFIWKQYAFFLKDEGGESGKRLILPTKIANQIIERGLISNSNN